MERQQIRKLFNSVETKAIEGRRLTVRISTNSVDRSGDIVQPQGAVLDNYIKNPIVAQFHNYSKPAIAKTIDIQTTDAGIMATLEFPPEGTYADADVLYELYKGGFMQAWSIGFIPLEYKDLATGGREYLRWELLEYSAVLVPDNPEALTMLRSKGLDTEAVEKEIKIAELKVKELIGGTEEKTEEKVEETEPAEEKEEEVEVVEVEKSKLATMEEQIKELREIKEGRVLSEKNRKLVSSAVQMLQDTAKALNDLLTATEPKQIEGEKNIDSAKEAFKLIDKIVGQTLRDLKKV